MTREACSLTEFQPSKVRKIVLNQTNKLSNIRTSMLIIYAEESITENVTEFIELALVQ